MTRGIRKLLFLVCALGLVPYVHSVSARASTPYGECLTVEDERGSTILRVDGRGVTSLVRGPQSPSASAGATRTNARAHRERVARNLAISKPEPEPGSTVAREYRDGEGRFVVASDGLISSAGVEPGPGVLPGGADGEIHTIDWMETESYYSSPYEPGGSLTLIGSADTYHLDDGSSWNSGAGSYTVYSSKFNHVEVVGNVVRFVLNPPASGFLYKQTDFDSGDHSAQGVLGVAGPLVLEATIGSSQAVLSGAALIVSNDITDYGLPKFNFYSAVVGSVVPFALTYVRTDGGTWGPTTFDQAFSYYDTGVVDFKNPISVPAFVTLKIVGSSQVPAGATVPFLAVASYENGVQKNVTADAAWQVTPDRQATIAGGLLTTTPDSIGAGLTVHAEHSEGGATLSAQKPVTVVDPDADLADSWEMYQGNRRHTGYVDVYLDPKDFALRWQRQVGSGNSLNPVTASAGKVFVTLGVYFDDVPQLYALDAFDGGTLWTKSFGEVFSVNPPSYAYGNVYVQTGNHGNDTYLRAFDADSGDLVLQAAHTAQWERYYAPTIHDGSVYINGGYYGGMYAFDAFGGTAKWFKSLPQYDQWTPAVDGDLAYAYVGGTLFAVDRHTGDDVYTIDDPGFEWNGWSMDLAPVLGGLQDVLVIHNGRLVSFDIQAHSIRWQLSGNFIGQPSVTGGEIFTISAGGLSVRDQATGQSHWSWQPPGSNLTGSMVVTNSHVLASTSDAVYAIDRLSHETVWNYPFGGRLALSQDALYIAGAGGTLTAISMPESIPSPLTGLTLYGPTRVVENSKTQFTAIATYENGRVSDRTLLADWSVEPGTFASFVAPGSMTTTELMTLSQPVVIHGTYEENGITVEAELAVELVIGVSVEEFFLRNVEGAGAIEDGVLTLLEQALQREHAAREALRALHPPGAVTEGSESGSHALQPAAATEEVESRAHALQRAVNATLRAHQDVGQSKQALESILGGKTAAAEEPQPPRRPQARPSTRLKKPTAYFHAR